MKNEGLNVAVVGATGLVGDKMLEILEERNFPVGELVPLASQTSVDLGRTALWRGRSMQVKNALTYDPMDIDIALFSAGADASRLLAPKFADAGAIVIDNSSAWRKDRRVPLVVSEVNPEALDNIPENIVANPNCTTMIAMPVMKPLHDAAGLRRMTVSTYQAVSGAGRAGMAELTIQSRRLIGMSGLIDGLPQMLRPKPETFAAPIAYNVVPSCGDQEGDDTVEELKLLHESRKILGLSRLAVSATCVRVPVYNGHALSVNAFFREPISPDEATRILQGAPGVQLMDIPTPIDAAGRDDVQVGRIRKDRTGRNGLAMFITGDNLRKGAALNAVQLAELVVDKYF